jgi:hypothetical protein
MLTLSNIIHGAEFWLAATIYLLGAASALGLLGLIEWLAERGKDGR